MTGTVLSVLLESLRNRESIAILNVTAADGKYAHNAGKHALVWLDSSRLPVSDLDLGSFTSQIYAAARQALDERKHRHLDFKDQDGAVKIFVEVQAQPPHLIIVGAGHIAVPLASIASTCDFEVTVLDDRPQYAHTARFPTAERVIAGEFRAELQNLRSEIGFGRHTYIVLVTRGHQYDVASLLEVLDDPMGYIGMIGSQRRIRAVFELLENEQGIPPEKFARVYAPVGIDIGAQTPAEIAVCIMAEIINVMREGPALSLSEQIRQERNARRQRVVPT